MDGNGNDDLDELDDLTEINYETIMRWTGYKRGAKSRHKVTDALAMSKQRDPFWSDSLARKERAEWFKSLWDRFDLQPGKHLRAVHYRLVQARIPVIKWDGERYLNTEEDWDALVEIVADARYLGLIPADALEDRRNDAPVLYVPDETEPAVVLDDAYPWGVSLSAFTYPPDFAITYPARGRQKYQRLLICEKTSLNDVLIPVCEERQASLVTAKGELSVTQTQKIVQRIVEDGRPARIFHLTDHDPSGATMPVSTARKIEFWLRKAGFQDVTFAHIALNREQVAEYDLPPIPLKDKDLRRAKFEARHGGGGVELDAFLEIAPEILASIVREAFDPWFDYFLAERVQEMRDALERACEDARDAALDPFAERTDDLRERIDALRVPIAPQIAALDAEARALGEEITDALRAVVPDVADFAVPEPEDADTDDVPAPLFDGRRGYGTQMRHYKRFQGKETTDDQ